jgi:hypothetical protein
VVGQSRKDCGIGCVGPDVLFCSPSFVVVSMYI